MAPLPLITRPRAVNAVNNHPCLLSDMHPLKGCKGKFKNSEIYAMGWKGFSREEISRTIIKQPKQTYVLVFPTYFNRSSILHWKCILPQFFPHISKYSLYHVAIAASPNPRPLFHVQPFVGAEKTAGRGFGQIESRWPNPSSNILFCISSNIKFCISFHQG